MSVLASREGIALLLVGVLLGLAASAVFSWLEPVAQARAQIGSEIDVVPLSGSIQGAHGGTAVIYAKMAQDGDVEIGYYEFLGQGAAARMKVWHSTSQATWDQPSDNP